MAWKIEGTYFETCSCEVVCPCTASLALGADYERCRVTLVFHVTDGDVEGTDVDGLTVAPVADTPQVMSDGDWRLGSSSTRTPPTSRPRSWAACSAASSAVEVQEDGLRHSVRIGDAVDFEVEDVVPFGSPSREPARLTGIFHPAGTELTIARATRSSISAFGIEYEGKAAFSLSHFTWAA
jgi:hypothetical protein